VTLFWSKKARNDKLLAQISTFFANDIPTGACGMGGATIGAGQKA
jgi:hypothetical protein